MITDKELLKQLAQEKHNQFQHELYLANDELVELDKKRAELVLFIKRKSESVLEYRKYLDFKNQ